MSYIGSTPTSQNFIAGTDYFNGTGPAVNFTLSRLVNSVNDIEVIVNNVEQIPSGYTISGSTLTFSAAPSAGTNNIYVRYLSTTLQSITVPAGTIVAGNFGVSGNLTLYSYTESVAASGTVTTAATLSLATGTVLTATLTASTACTFTMPTNVAGKSFVLLLKQAAATGNGTATFTGVKWPTAGAPTITATAGKMDILTFVADGTNWYGTYVQGYTP